jgi:hypothetical protein
VVAAFCERGGIAGDDNDGVRDPLILAQRVGVGGRGRGTALEGGESVAGDMGAISCCSTSSAAGGRRTGRYLRG